MMTALLAAVGGVTLLVGGGGIILLEARGDTVMRERVRLAGGQAEGGAAPAITTQQSIRSRNVDTTPGMTRLFRWIGHKPDMGSTERLPWPVIVLLGIAFGALGAWRSRGWVGDWLFVPAGILIGIKATQSLFKRGRTKYSGQLFKQIPDAIGLIIRAIRAGIPMAEALRSVAREMPEPTRGEFGRVVGAVSIGRPVDEAIWTLFHRTGLLEYSYLAVTISLQTQAGGSLAETLENLGEMVRKRVAMAGKARALAGEAKIQAMVMIALPFLAALGLSFIQEGYIDTFLNTPTGNNMALTGLTMIGCGALTMRWLTARAVKD